MSSPDAQPVVPEVVDGPSPDGESQAPPESDEGGTGGMLGADEIVLDGSGRVANSGAEEVVEGESGLSDAELRAVWLRRVRNDPADFLRARFAWQLQREESEDGTRASPD